MLPKVSIIIPALNEAGTITSAVDRAWSTGPHEVIVVDGGSRDATAEFARARGARVIESSPGRGRQQNTGARQATGDVLLFLHADNWLAADGLDQIAVALADPSVAGGAFWQRIDCGGFCYRLLERGNAWRAARRKLPYGDQGIFLRREVFARLGPFPETPLMEDVLLMRKLRRRARLVLLAGPVHVSPRRWRRHGIVRQTMRNWLLLMATRLGISPKRLAGFYRRHDAG